MSSVGEAVNTFIERGLYVLIFIKRIFGTRNTCYEDFFQPNFALHFLFRGQRPHLKTLYTSVEYREYLPIIL